MSEMIERVARAMYDFAEGPGKWEGTSVEDVKMAGYFARAAIAAMRGPTTKMIHAAAAAMSPGKRPTQKQVSCSRKHAIRYNAMIDEALR